MSKLLKVLYYELKIGYIKILLLNVFNIVLLISILRRTDAVNAYLLVYSYTILLSLFTFQSRNTTIMTESYLLNGVTHSQIIIVRMIYAILCNISLLIGACFVSKNLYVIIPNPLVFLLTLYCMVFFIVPVIPHYIQNASKFTLKNLKNAPRVVVKRKIRAMKKNGLVRYNISLDNKIQIFYMLHIITVFYVNNSRYGLYIMITQASVMFILTMFSLIKIRLRENKYELV